MNTKVKLIIVMGVSGCGKSSVAHGLAEHFNYQFIEADEFHSQENKQWMANGQALTDAMREPWIALLQTHLRHLADAGSNCVLSFSGLRKAHREKMRELPFDVQFLHLEGEQRLISKRMATRTGHFMPANLLDSQFLTLEKPDAEGDVSNINIDQELENVITDAVNAICL